MPLSVVVFEFRLRSAVREQMGFKNKRNWGVWLS